MTYTYDAGGNLATLTTPSGVITAYAYSGSRPKEVTVTAGSESQTIRNIEYLPFGPRTRAEFPPEDGVTGENTVVSTREHNLRYQVTEIDVTTPTETVLDLSYTYDYTAGAPGPVDSGPNLDRVVDHRDASESRFYFYDELERLWKATDLSGNPIYTYLYDANGNRSQQVSPAGTTTYSHEAGTDRLAQATGAEPRHYANDAYGSRIWAGLSAYSGASSLIYDESNRLVEVRDPGTLSVLGQYTYDGLGRRVRRMAGGITALSFYRPGAHMVETRTLGTLPAMTRRFVLAEDEPVGVVEQAAGGSPYFAWVHGDHRTTPRAVTSSSSSGTTVIWRASYAPFGLAAVQEDPDGDSQAFDHVLRLPGQVFDSESGMHQEASRAYDPTLGRYASPEDHGAEANNAYEARQRGEDAARSLATVHPLGPAVAGTLGAAGIPALDSCDAHPLQCYGPHFRPRPLPRVPPVPPPVPCPPSDNGCAAKLVTCLENKFWAGKNHPYGYPLDCASCFFECDSADGAWPYYKCPLPEPN